LSSSAILKATLKPAGPGKRERLTHAGADVVIDAMMELADALRLAAAQS
jgi:hypothetical protein